MEFSRLIIRRAEGFAAVRVHLALGLGLLASIITVLGQTPVQNAELPPPPKFENRRGLPPAQREAADKRNSATLSTWQSRLSKEQREAWYASTGTTDPRATERYRYGDKKLPAIDSGYDWKSAARALLTDAEMAQLGRDKILLEDVFFKQSFELYTTPGAPVFITSDSLLNAFHVLFEDSFRELETRRALELRVQLERVLAKVRELMNSPRNRFSPAELAPGWRHAQLVVGPALRLLGSKPEVCDADVRDEVERQVELIRQAEKFELPPWLGPPSRTLLTIDYRRCKPIGFYKQRESLQDYFRAVRWLQSIPFRADRDNELTAIGLLGCAVGRDFGAASEFFRGYHAIIGRPDDPSLNEASSEFQNFLSGPRDSMPWQNALVWTRRWLLRSKISGDEFRKLSDTNRLPPDANNQLAELHFRVLSASRLPDSLVLARTSQSSQLPNGLAVAALLGSDFARQRLTHVPAGVVEAALKEARDDWQPSDDEYAHRRSLYDGYLRVLSALVTPAEPDAPEFMRREAWAAKSCHTALASWAQMRHTFTLQAKENVFYGGLVDVPPGFVEPNPEFFRRLADLVEGASMLLETGGAFAPSQPETDGSKDAASADTEPGALRRQWRVMTSATRRLEAMAHKQLRQQPWTSDEADFIKGYGAELAFIMGYFGNSWLKPRDDAPRWATVTTDPNHDVMLAVGVGRPRLLHVLYPWQGQEILCTGSVMSYYEYPEKRRLTDAEWKTKLDSADAPPQPAWLAPYVAK